MRLGDEIVLQLIRGGDESKKRGEGEKQSESCENGSPSKHQNTGISRAEVRKGRAEMTGGDSPEQTTHFPIQSQNSRH